MVAEGHRMVAQRWTLFEKAVRTAGPGDLLQLLCHLKGVTTPTPPPAPPLAPRPVPMDVPPQQQGTPLSSPVKIERGDQPVVLIIEGVRSWACPQCNTIRGSKNGCNAHIRQAYTGKALVCALCRFSTYNMDSLQRHEKEHN